MECRDENRCHVREAQVSERLRGEVKQEFEEKYISRDGNREKFKCGLRCYG